MIIFETESDIISTDVCLNYRYGIRTQLTTNELSMNSFQSDIVNIFNQAISNCTTYSPFQFILPYHGLFSEFTVSNYRPILEALFVHCILSSIETAKYLMFSFYPKEISKLVSSPKTNDEMHYIFKCSSEKQLNYGYFYQKHHCNSTPSAIYDYDSSKWQSNRRTLESMHSKKFMKKIITAYGITFPIDKKSKRDIYLKPYYADFTSHLLLNSEILSTIKIIDKHINMLTNKTTGNSQKNNSYTRSIEFSFQKHIKNFSSHDPRKIFENILPNVDNNLDFVDSLIFADQLENILHANLYSYLFSFQQQKYFEQYLKRFNYQENFNCIKYENAYFKFAENALKTISMSTNCTTPVFIDYAIRCLENYHNYYDLPKYPSHLINNQSIASIPGHTPVEQSHAFDNWIIQFNKYIRILTDLYLPILEKTFFLLLKNYISTQPTSTNYIINMMDKLYNYIDTNKEIFVRENPSYQKLYEDSPNETYKKLSFDCRKSKTPDKNTMDITLDYISRPELTKSFILHAYGNPSISLRDDTRLKSVSNLYYASDPKPEKPNKLDFLFAQYEGQIIDYFSEPFEHPTT